MRQTRFWQIEYTQWRVHSHTPTHTLGAGRFALLCTLQKCLIWVVTCECHLHTCLVPSLISPEQKNPISESLPTDVQTHDHSKDNVYTNVSSWYYLILDTYIFLLLLYTWFQHVQHEFKLTVMLSGDSEHYIIMIKHAIMVILRWKENNLSLAKTSFLPQQHFFLNKGNSVLVQQRNLHSNPFVCAQETLCHI